MDIYLYGYTNTDIYMETLCIDAEISSDGSLDTEETQFIHGFESGSAPEQNAPTERVTFVDFRI